MTAAHSPVLLLPERYSADSIALWRAATSAGWDVRRVYGWSAPSGLKGRETVLYGETIFCRFLAEALSLELEEPPLDWLARLPERYRLREVRFATLEEALRAQGPLFFKPADEKEFPAAVYSSGSDIPAQEWLPPETPVLIAEPVEWEVEFRCFVRERQLEALSPYLRGGELAVTEEGAWPAPEEEREAALDFAGSVLKDTGVELPAAAVLDVGLIRGRGWAVVEANPAWGAGIYGCDPDGVLPVLRRATRPLGTAE